MSATLSALPGRGDASPAHHLLGKLDLSKLDRAYAVIVQHFTQTPGVVHQVTLRPDKVKDGFIRLGDTQGDELVGWNYPNAIEVLSVLGEAYEEAGQWKCRPVES